MACALGSVLYDEYQVAQERKLAGALKSGPNSDSAAISRKEASASKQDYIEKYANWLGHRAFCHDCKPKG